MYRVWLWWVARPEFARVECPSCQSQPSLFRAKESPLTHNQTLWDKQICLCLGCWKFYVDINLGLVAVIRCWTDENKYFTSKQTFGADRKTFSGALLGISGARRRWHLIKISKESPALGMSLTFRTLRIINTNVCSLPPTKGNSLKKKEPKCIVILIWLRPITTSLWHRFSAFWLRSKCSICSYQLNIWYGGHVPPSILNWFLQGDEVQELAPALSRVGLALQYRQDRPTSPLNNDDEEERMQRNLCRKAL